MAASCYQNLLDIEILYHTALPGTTSILQGYFSIQNDSAIPLLGGLT